jgi:uridylate kinase
MESIVISIGGSVILSDNIDNQFFYEFKKIIKKISKKYKIFIVVGGGKTARDYINLGRKLNLNENVLDIFGILVTRINAKFLDIILNNTNSEIPETTNDALNLKKKIVVMGGTIPGHSTDYVGSKLAQKSKSKKLIIATNVDGVYDKDPNKYKNARKIREITAKELISKYGTKWQSAGSNVIIDGPALRIIENNNILTYVLNGKKLNELEKAINNEKFNGTIIKNKRIR